ncbi:valine--tRNA ligase [Sphingomonas lacunae]|uniref:Valine--tRNA ligase n=1 Tax=Sphingomonas lacunae TaxID=2698828 RepID=A0A6M4AYC9_9SPHN|nr:valine--tRNA ligase [Sphingomonas lacunae]QJQ33360.1 valine--tRNA ligase [Sphingomonas lacunae]
MTDTPASAPEPAKTFDPAAIEARWAAHWEANGLFRPERPDATPFTIVNPPPNVTGALHIGHALDNTLQDVLVRYERLRGKDALWVVGTDHAGIATQMVVERQMAEKQDRRTNYSREQFIDKVWEWKAESGGQITGQLRRLGCSMDWSREQFTMDPHFTKAVVKVFVDLYNQGLLYRDKRLVNWDPGLKTAISDLEVETQEVKGSFWHFKYPLADGVKRDDGLDYIEVATTRPETMLADMAIAVHPEDERYKSIIGKDILQPITGRRFKVVADEHADPELGSGAVKITPGHDFNDFEVGKRAGIKPAEMLNMFDADARVVQVADGLIPAEFIGLDRFDARKAVVEAMKALGFLIPHVTRDKEGNETLHDAEPRTIQTPFGDRSGQVIEPWLTDQWYVDAATLAQPAIEAVKSGAIEIVPKTWEKTFFNWMENIQPWCVSRQLWWGHRIPAWYAEDGQVFVAETEEEAQALAGTGVALNRDEDVLDTWFSSALWPFATLGWPEQSDLLARHYPNDVLISGFDILFFWDARMAMQGLHFMKEVPWRRLYLHGLVRDAKGAKMSKSKGNVVDPLGLIDQYGADALRFFMSAMESQGRDIKMDEARLEGYRNFATKLWNAARFCQSNGIGASKTLAAPAATLPVNRWIIGEVAATVTRMQEAFATLRFDDAANAIYQFAWSRFCDWYLELIKGQIDDETRAVAGWVLDQILVMLHPFMPFITEELWHNLGDRPYELIVAKWPEPAASSDAEASADIDWLITLVQSLRGAKAELGIAPGARLPLFAEDADAATQARIARMAAALDRVGRIEAVHIGGAPAGAAMQLVVEGATYVVPLEGLIDIDAERARLTKALAAAQKEAASLAGRLSNPAFTEKAKPEAVEKAREDHAARAAEAERLEAALKRLG